LRKTDQAIQTKIAKMWVPILGPPIEEHIATDVGFRFKRGSVTVSAPGIDGGRIHNPFEGKNTLCIVPAFFSDGSFYQFMAQSYFQLGTNFFPLMSVVSSRSQDSRDVSFVMEQIHLTIPRPKSLLHTIVSENSNIINDFNSQEPTQNQNEIDDTLYDICPVCDLSVEKCNLAAHVESHFPNSDDCTSCESDCSECEALWNMIP